MSRHSAADEPFLKLTNKFARWRYIRIIVEELIHCMSTHEAEMCVFISNGNHKMQRIDTYSSDRKTEKDANRWVYCWMLDWQLVRLIFASLDDDNECHRHIFCSRRTILSPWWLRNMLRRSWADKSNINIIECTNPTNINSISKGWHQQISHSWRKKKVDFRLRIGMNNRGKMLNEISTVKWLN